MPLDLGKTMLQLDRVSRGLVAGSGHKETRLPAFIEAASKVAAATATHFPEDGKKGVNLIGHGGARRGRPCRRPAKEAARRGPRGARVRGGRSR